MKKALILLIVLLAAIAGSAYAKSLEVTVQGVRSASGTIQIYPTTAEQK